MKTRHKIIAGLHEAISYAKGVQTGVKVSQYNVPESIDVRSLRLRLKMSQPEFALRFGFSLGTLRQWEQGRRYPDGAARVLLTVINRDPEAVKKALESEPEQRVEKVEKKKVACG